MLIQSRAGHVLLIHHYTTKPLDLPFPYGVVMSAAYFNIQTGKRTSEGEITLPGPVTIHLVPTERYLGWCYLQWRDEIDKQYKCTCAEGVSANFCKHIYALECVAA